MVLISSADFAHTHTLSDTCTRTSRSHIELAPETPAYAWYAPGKLERSTDCRVFCVDDETQRLLWWANVEWVGGWFFVTSGVRGDVVRQNALRRDWIDDGNGECGASWIVNRMGMLYVRATVKIRVRLYLYDFRGYGWYKCVWCVCAAVSVLDMCVHSAEGNESERKWIGRMLERRAANERESK